MRFSLSSWDVKKVVEELSFLPGTHISQIYYNEHSLRIRLSALTERLPEMLKSGGEGRYSRFDMIFKLPGALFILPQGVAPPSPPPTSFAMALRKHLSGSAVEGIEQVGGDRIMRLRLRRGEEEAELIVEMFSKGNIIMVKGGEIALLLRREEFASRKLQPSLPYTPPPSTLPLCVLEVEGVGEEVGEKVRRSGRRAIAAALVKELSLPPPIAREVLHRAGIGERTPAEEAWERWDRIVETLEELLEELKSGGCYVYWLEDEVLTSPVELRHLTREGERHPTYLKALLSIYSSLVGEEERKGDVTEGVAEEDQNRLERRLKMQREALERLEEEMKRCRELAECIYRHYGELQGIVEIYDSSGGDPKALIGLEERGVKEVDTKKKVALVEVDDQLLGRVELELPLDRGVNGAAQLYYERAKTARRKIKGLRKAMEETERLIRKEAVEEKRPEARWKPRRRFWFDPYRWFITSRGRIAVAGRDAKSNERVVKRYLKEGDIYLHADVQGASSVVLKMEGGEVDEKELEEAAQFAVINSKAWRAAHAFGRAFWVLPHQVSKTPPSGEFLPRGSFMIRGKKNFVDHLPLRCAAGPVEVEGERRFMCGPESALRAHAPWFIVLEPGETPRREVLSALERLSGLPRELIEQQLPPGDFKIVEVHGGEGVRAAFRRLLEGDSEES